ncbi:hypothetical protein ACFFHK_00250 [Gallibacterium trehalosifermentans]|uniref:Assembly protein n=1 Tax=Gallibacterium trehalosifermentans TaxID=516935 RepID=A0ABV6GXP0_9PAST
MKKWWVIGIILVILVAGGIIRNQVIKITQNITQRLSSDYAIHLQPQDFVVSYFPLSVQIKNVNYQREQWQVSADKIIFKLNYLGWLSNNQWLKQIQIINGEIKQLDQTYLDKVRLTIETNGELTHTQNITLIHAETPQFTMLQGQFSLQQREDVPFLLQQLKLQGQLREAIAQRQNIDIAVDSIAIDHRQSTLNLKAERVIFNQFQMPEFVLRRGGDQTSYLFGLSDGVLQITQQKIDEQKTAWTLQGERVPAIFFSTILGYSPVIEGRLDVQGRALQFQNTLSDAEFNFTSVSKGKFKGINVLGLLGNALPFPIAGFEQDMQDTEFEHIAGQLQGNSRQWHLQQAEIILHGARLLGRGKIYPSTAQCDWQFAIQPTKREYTQYHLNLDLDGNCFSPTYRIRLDDTIKNKLKLKLNELLNKF